MKLIERDSHLWKLAFFVLELPALSVATTRSLWAPGESLCAGSGTEKDFFELRLTRLPSRKTSVWAMPLASETVTLSLKFVSVHAFGTFVMVTVGGVVSGAQRAAVIVSLSRVTARFGPAGGR